MLRDRYHRTRALSCHYIRGIAWAFTISKKTDVYGQVIEVPWLDYGNLLIAKAELFEFDMQPRNERIAKEIELGWKGLKDPRSKSGIDREEEK